MYIIKRDGTEVEFDADKIRNAVKGANRDVPSSKRIPDYKIEAVVGSVTEHLENLGRAASVEEIQELVIRAIQEELCFDVAVAYAIYRYKREIVRKSNSTDKTILTIVNSSNELVKQENSNKNPINVSTQRDYMAGTASIDISRRYLLPSDVVDADSKGIIHFHDQDYFAQQMHNCCLINMEDMLQNGTMISGTFIDPPKSLRTAANLATQIVAQVASTQYGGQSWSLAHLAPFVDISRKKLIRLITENLKGVNVDDKIIKEMAENMLMREIRDAVQTIQYQLITLQTTNGQAPFVTIFMYINEVPEGQQREDLALLIKYTLEERILGVKDATGTYVPPAFPKLIYVLDENNVTSDSEYFYLTKLAAECTAKRMVPDYISAKIMKELKGDVYTCMGCRSFLTPDRFTDAGIGNIAHAKNYIPGKHKYYGRFNQGVVTLNLVDVACSSKKDIDEFWKILNDRLELCHRALQCRHKRLLGTLSDRAPIQWQYGALARLKPGEVIDPLLFNGYSTISLGYAGLYEMTYYMTGKSHTEPGGHEFAIDVMKALNDACNKWKAEENIDYSVYGTPLESTTYKFAQCLQKRFGIIPNVTDHNYITNSYHVCVREEIDAFEKLKFEAEFQKLSPGGAISYIEVPNMVNNLDAVISVIQYIYDTILYAEINTKLDHCLKCGYEGEIEIKKDDNGKLVWECPNCHNRDQSLMHVVRRTCGYIGTNFWNQGRTQEIQDRVLHL